MTPRVSASQARSELAEILNRVAYQGDRVVLHRRGKDVAAIVSLEDLELIEELEDRLDTEAVLQAWDEQGDEPPAPWEEVKKRLSLA